VGFTGDSRRQIERGGADRLARGRIADFLQEFQMAVRMAGLAFRRGTEHRGDIVVTFHVGLLGKIEITAVRLGLARESVFQVCSVLLLFKDGIDLSSNYSRCRRLDSV